MLLYIYTVYTVILIILSLFVGATFQFTMTEDRIGGIAVDGQYLCKKKCENIVIGNCINQMNHPWKS